MNHEFSEGLRGKYLRNLQRNTQGKGLNLVGKLMFRINLLISERAGKNKINVLACSCYIGGPHRILTSYYWKPWNKWTHHRLQN